MKDWDDEILGFDLVFIGQNNTDFISSSAIIGCFKMPIFRDLTQLYETLSRRLHSCMHIVCVFVM